MSLSVIVPCFNEEKTIYKIISKVYKVLSEQKIIFEIIIVDDGSTDHSINKIKELPIPYILLRQKNTGKGRAVQNGINHAKNKYIVVQDSDLEYSPHDIIKLYKHVDIKVAVYGSRMIDKKTMRFSRPSDYALTSFIASVSLTILHFLLYRTFISDTLTGYKIYPKHFFDLIDIQSNGFETDHEITGLLLKNNYTIIECPISYYPRTKSEGKKINFFDFLKAIKITFSIRFTKI